MIKSHCNFEIANPFPIIEFRLSKFKKGPQTIEQLQRDIINQEALLRNSSN